MKIKNDYTIIKIGKKQHELRNTILDTYLKKFVKAQTQLYDEMTTDKVLSACLLKFDEPLDFQTDSIISNEQFDIGIIKYDNLIDDLNENGASIQYLYTLKKNDTYYDYSKLDLRDNLEEFYGRKITAIGFNNDWDKNFSEESFKPVCAILDTSNYNIYLQENQDLAILRKDIISTDGYFYSDGYRGPVHLSPYYARANLYSIGLSYYKDYCDKEFIIAEDLDWKIKDTEIIIKGIENYLVQNSPLFCSKDVHCNPNLYPKKANYRYIILKYRVYDDDTEGKYLLDGEYSIYVPITKFGKINLKIKFERG